jgi:hypothetical protein
MLGERVVRWRRREQPDRRALAGLTRWPDEPYAFPYEKPANSREPWPCRLYLIYVWDPRTNYQTITLGYLGETGHADPAVRFGEHLEDKPWADTVAAFIAAGPAGPVGAEGPAGIVLDPAVVAMLNTVYACKADVYVAEEALTRRLRPLYPVEYNLDNPDRIEPWQALAQRAARDAARGIPLEQSWVVLYRQRHPEPPSGSGAGVRGWTGRVQWKMPRIRLGRAGWLRVGWGTVWAILTAVLWLLAWKYVPILSGWRLPGVAGAAAGAVLARIRQGRRRRGRGRARGRWQGRQLGWLAVRVALVVACAAMVAGPVMGWLHHFS